MFDKPIHIPATWEIDKIQTVRGKLFRLTGYRRFGTEILAATLSGELPADGGNGLLKGSGGNLEHARALGRRASVDWDDVAEWLRAKGYDVRRGHWIECDEALTQLQARITPAPTATELEDWIWFCGLKAYVDARSDQRYLIDNLFCLNIQKLPERRLHVWLDSEEVAAFEPSDRMLTLPQLCERWQADEPKVQARLKQAPAVISWPLLGNEQPELFEFTVALESVRAIESDHPGWLKFDAFAPDPQLQWLEPLERERHDRQRLSELMRSDPAGIHGRQRATKALDMYWLSCWLEPNRIATLYGDPVLFDTLSQVAFVVLPARPVCHGFAIHVDAWLRWPGRPKTPEGKAGELVRGWLSMATHDDQTDDSKQPATVTELTLKSQRLDEIDAELGKRLDAVPETITGAGSTETNRLQERIEIIVQELGKHHSDLLALPFGAKVRLRERLCEEQPKLFTESTFEKAWTAGTSCEIPRFRLTKAEKFGRGRKVGIRPS